MQFAGQARPPAQYRQNQGLVDQRGRSWSDRAALGSTVIAACTGTEPSRVSSVERTPASRHSPTFGRL